MGAALEPVTPPPPSAECSPKDILLGPPITPEDRIKLYSPSEFEDFICEWAFFFLQKHTSDYTRVVRYGGSGDLGRDIVGYVDDSSTPPICDVYQCKHYAHPLRPAEFWPELAKLCYFTFRNELPMPRRYRVVAPQDVGPDLGRLLDDPSALKDRLVREWLNNDKITPLSRKITSQTQVILTGPLREHVDRFPFSIVGHKPIHDVISEHRQTIRYPARFGGGLTRPVPADKAPPSVPASSETRYVEQLLHAYRDHTKTADITLDRLSSDPGCTELGRHFQRSRERYYSAETLREFSRDNLPEQYPFEQIQEQVLDGVIDTAESDHRSGYERVCKTTDAAAQVRVSNHPLEGYIKGKALRGVCHQLANENRLIWVRGHGTDDI